MKIPPLPFTVTDWSGIAPTVHPGETGEAIWRTFTVADLRVRQVEYSPGLLQFDDIERFVPEGALLKNGMVKPADLLVLAIGYHPQPELVRRLLGQEIADRVGQVWGIGTDGGLVHGRRADAIPNLFENGGSANQGDRDRPDPIDFRAMLRAAASQSMECGG